MDGGSGGAKRSRLDVDCVLRPVLPEELVNSVPLVEVYVDTIADPKNTSKIVVALNSKLPAPHLGHLKRVRGKEILLSPALDSSVDELLAKLRADGFELDYLANRVRRVQVAAIPPKTRKQYEEVHKLWPCNFHSDKYLEKLCTNTLFSRQDIEKHLSYMRMAIDVSKLARRLEKSSRTPATVVVDPKIDSVVAIGFDRSRENPLQHSVMLAIDNVALTQKGGAWGTESGIPQEVSDALKTKYSSFGFGAAQFKDKTEIESPDDGPYLCTSYYVYTTHEPCIMCAMALVHSRAKRVFYGKSCKFGALGSLCKIHTVKGLNHHYEVFSGLLENDCEKL